MGKTGLAADLARAAAQACKGVFLVSLEMSEEEVSQRLVAASATWT